MFDVLRKAIDEAKEEDAERLNKRKTKRVSRGGQGTDEIISIRESVSIDITNAQQRSTFARSSVQPSFSMSLTEPKGSVATKQQSLSDDVEEDDDELREEHPHWKSDNIVIIYMIGFAVAASNIWRFGYLCHEHGGIYFLIPYTFFTLVCAWPCMYLEVIIGQYAQVGTIAAWRLAPVFKGVGMCMILVSYMSTFTIQTVLAWSLFYMFQSVFYHPLPWISCDNGFGKHADGQKDETMVKWVEHEGDAEHKNWHTENCTEFYADSESDSGVLGPDQHLPGAEFFRGRVQRMWRSAYADAIPLTPFNSINGNGTYSLSQHSQQEGILEYNADTFMTLVVVFILLEICIARGIKFSPKIMINLVLGPYVFLAILFYRATGLNGAWDGLWELLRPNASKLADIDTWYKSGEQVFYSTGAGFGIHQTLASHSPINRKLVHFTTVTIVVNFCTSLLCACIIFMYLGHVKVAVHRELQMFVLDGPELVFEVMSDVLGVLAKANFYAFCFYFTVFLFAFTSVSVTLLAAKYAYLEILPVSVKYKMGSRIMLMSVIYMIGFVASSLNLTRGGLHIYQFMNSFVGVYSVMLCTFLFLIGISWFFGLREIVEACQTMEIRVPGIYFQICWKYITPCICIFLFTGLILNAGDHGITYHREEIPISVTLKVVGYLLAIGPLFVVIGGAIHAVWKAPGNNCKEKWLTSISPTKEHRDILATGTGKRARWTHFFYLYAETPGSKCNVFCKLADKPNKPTSHISVLITEDAPSRRETMDENGTLFEESASDTLELPDKNEERQQPETETGENEAPRRNTLSPNRKSEDETPHHHRRVSQDHRPRRKSENLHTHGLQAEPTKQCVIQ